MLGLGKSKKAIAPGRKVPLESREAWLEKQLAAAQRRYDELNGRYAHLYAINQSQARRIDELTGATEIMQAVSG